MNVTGRHAAALLLAAIVAAAAAACGGGGTPAVGAPPASLHAAAERAATLNWLAEKNLMWTKNDFSPLDQVTTGAARTAYLAQERATTSDPAPGSRTPFQLTSLSITVPCHQGAEAAFVAYGDTDVFTLGQSVQPVALIFQRSGGAWKLAAVVNQPSGNGSGSAAWPALCLAGAETTAPAVLPPAGYAATLSRALNRAAAGAPQTAAATAPFALKPFFAGPSSFTAQSATQISQDQADGVTLAERFSPTADPTLALPLADGHGYWLIGTLTQTASYSSAAGIRTATLPDGASLPAARPTVVHQATDTYITTYTATDPPLSAGGTVELDGFFGWPLAATAS
jgi:hypothetical protein